MHLKDPSVFLQCPFVQTDRCWHSLISAAAETVKLLHTWKYQLLIKWYKGQGWPKQQSTVSIPSTVCLYLTQTVNVTHTIIWNCRLCVFLEMAVFNILSCNANLSLNAQSGTHRLTNTHTCCLRAAFVSVISGRGSKSATPVSQQTHKILSSRLTTFEQGVAYRCTLTG